MCIKKYKALPVEGQYLISSNYTDQGRVLSLRRNFTVLDSTPYQGDRWLTLEKKLAPTVHDPYRKSRYFEASSSTFPNNKISVEITDQSLFDLDSRNYERFVIRKFDN